VPDYEARTRIFDRVDCNGNGCLSLAEVDKAAVEVWPQFNHVSAPECFVRVRGRIVGSHR
jgi:hypothetical protein